MHQLKVGNPWKFAFYAAVAHGHKSKLYFVPPSPEKGSKARRSKETLTSAHFKKTITELKKEITAWYPRGKGYFVLMDRATPHTSFQSQAHLAALKLPLKKDFPPQSWDINVIENVWGAFWQRFQGKHASSTAGWRQKIREAWDEVEQSTINKLVAQVPGRMQEIIDADGAWIRKKGAKHNF